MRIVRCFADGLSPSATIAQWTHGLRINETVGPPNPPDARLQPNLLKFQNATPFNTNAKTREMTLKVGNQYMYKKNCEINKLGPRIEPDKKHIYRFPVLRFEARLVPKIELKFRLKI
jgi:hypothetical protein